MADHNHYAFFNLNHHQTSVTPLCLWSTALFTQTQDFPFIPVNVHLLVWPTTPPAKADHCEWQLCHRVVSAAPHTLASSSGPFMYSFKALQKCGTVQSQCQGPPGTAASRYTSWAWLFSNIWVAPSAPSLLRWKRTLLAVLLKWVLNAQLPRASQDLPACSCFPFSDASRKAPLSAVK